VKLTSKHENDTETIGENNMQEKQQNKKLQRVESLKEEDTH